MRCLFSEDGVDICKEIQDFIDDPDQNALVLSFEHVSFKYNTRELLLNTLGRHLLGLARRNAFQEVPVVCFLDEAHQFIGRSIGDETNQVTLDAFGLIAKEGRKYGLTTGIATQRPRDVPTRRVEPIGHVVPRLHKMRETAKRLNGLAVISTVTLLPLFHRLAKGEAIIVGPELPAPLPVLIDQPERDSSRNLMDQDISSFGDYIELRQKVSKEWSSRADNPGRQYKIVFIGPTAPLALRIQIESSCSRFNNHKFRLLNAGVQQMSYRTT
jgi:hypothetical protein